MAIARRNFDEAETYRIPDSAAFQVAVAFAEAGEYARAEELFARAPGDFNTLMNLGSVAASAGHLHARGGVRRGASGSSRRMPRRWCERRGSTWRCGSPSRLSGGWQRSSEPTRRN